MTVVAGDIIRGTAQYNLATNAANQNVFYWEASAGVSDSEANVIGFIGAIFDAAYALIESILSTDVTDDEMVFAKRNPSTGKWEKIGTYDLTNPTGAAGADQEPNGVAAVVRFNSDGVGQQGRKFISGLESSGLGDNVLQGSVITALTNWAAAVDNAVGVGGGTMVAGWWSVIDTAFRAYNNVQIINTIAGYQRRRKPGIGI